MVPAAAVGLLRTAITNLSGPALARFAGMISSRLGITVSGTSANMASTLLNYVRANPMTAGLTAGTLAAATLDFDVEKFIEKWEAEAELPENVKYILDQTKQLAENRDKVTGDQDEDTVMGIETSELRKAALVLQQTDHQVKTLMREFGTIDNVIAVRNALFSLDDEQLLLFKERHSAKRY